MRIEFTGRQTEVPERLKALAQRKLQKLARVLPAITHAHVILGADKHRQVAEVKLHSRQLDLTAAEVSNDPRLSLLAALEKLERQAQRYKGRRRENKRRAAPPVPVEAGEPAAAAAAEPRLIRSRRSFVKPMTVEEAVLEMDGAGDRPVVFRDAVTEGVKVLYKRKDGHLGLLEPEV